MFHGPSLFLNYFQCRLDNRIQYTEYAFYNILLSNVMKRLKLSVGINNLLLVLYSLIKHNNHMHT